MTSQKTIERCRKDKADLLEVNKTLLENNEKLMQENSRLKLELNKNIETIKELEIQKTKCKQKLHKAL